MANTRGNHAVLYHRDSLGRSDQTPAKYAEWAQSESHRLGLEFDGSADAINSLIRTRQPECGDVYLDYNVAGNLLERPALSALKKRIESDKRVGHVFIPMRARLARPHDSEDGVRLEKQIRRMGVTIHYRDTTLAPLEANERADIGEQITSLISFEEAGKFRGDLADKMIEAQRNLSQQGLSTGGRPPFFLRRWLIDPQGRPVRELADGESVRMAGHHVAWLPTDAEKLALARRIVDLLEEMPATQVAKRLTMEGIPSPDAGRTRRDRGQCHSVSGAWHATTIVNVVRSLFLVGKAVYGQRSMGDQRRYSPEGPRELTDMDFRPDGEPKVIRNPESEWTVVAARFDALVEPERLERLLTELNKRGASQRGKPRSRDPANNPLGSRVYDMACGWPMYREPYTKKGESSFRYKCGQYTQSHAAACTSNSIDGPSAVRLTLGAIHQRLASPSLRARIAEKLEALANRAQADNPVQSNIDTTSRAIVSIRKELEIVTRNLSRAENDVQYQAISAEFERLKKQESQLDAELQRLKGESHALQDPAKEVAAAIGLLDRLNHLATKKVESFTAARELIGLVDAKLFLKFEQQTLGKRLVFKPIGGFLTFGVTSPPIKLYEGHTGRVALQNALKSSGSPPCQCGQEDEPTIEKADSLRNVSRGDRTPIELFLAGANTIASLLTIAR